MKKMTMKNCTKSTPTEGSYDNTVQTRGDTVYLIQRCGEVALPQDQPLRVQLQPGGRVVHLGIGPPQGD